MNIQESNRAGISETDALEWSECFRRIGFLHRVNAEAAVSLTSNKGTK